MEISITLRDLGMIILFLTIMAVGVYAVITLRSVNGAVREISDMLRRHRRDLDELSQSVPHIAETSANAVEVSREVRKRVYEVGKALELISRDTTDTVLRVNATADHVASYVLVFGEVAKGLLELFSKGKRG
jgi:hypothetical protein